MRKNITFISFLILKREKALKEMAKTQAASSRGMAVEAPEMPWFLRRTDAAGNLGPDGPVWPRDGHGCLVGLCVTRWT